MPETDTLSKLTSAKEPQEIRDVLLALGFNGLFFQRWRPGVIENWEGSLPAGFLEHYYGLFLYRNCPVAHAIHRWRRDYTFAEVREANLSTRCEVTDAKKVWDSFDLKDGVVLLTGRENETGKSACILTCAGPAEPLFARFGPLLALAARRLDILLTDHSEIQEVTRSDPELSKTQELVLRIQIDNPNLTYDQMAASLGMSVRALQAHHKRIAKKHNVSSFTSAVVEAMHSGK
ncbi:MAG: hypothetical protein HQ513_10650 [Rhodospirillales bacterium]|nr:hypothetical protein [Rhodospirillales bacterium]